jgi:hypothetical protein
MTPGAAGHRILIRLTGDQAQDLKALQSWLSLEEWFTDAQAQHGLRVVYRERDGSEQAAGPDGPPMGGVVTEIVLMLASGVLTPVIEDVYRHAKTSARAFAANLSSSRRRVEAQVTAEDGAGGDADGGTDGGTGGTGGTGDGPGNGTADGTGGTGGTTGSPGRGDGEAGRIG